MTGSPDLWEGRQPVTREWTAATTSIRSMSSLRSNTLQVEGQTRVWGPLVQLVTFY